MSQKEMEALDAEMLEMANRGSSTDIPVEERKENIPEAPQPSTFWPDVQESIEAEKREHKKWLRRHRAKAVLWIVICLLAATSLIIASLVPAVFPWIANTGILCFIVAAAIILDRLIRGWMV